MMFQGTGSDVGKTLLVAGLCRLFLNRGMKVSPFKPQNMSNNAAVADDGGEIGRAQWLQAWGAKIPPSKHMNPVLLKPESERGSQIIVHGEVYGVASGRDYQALKPKLMEAVMESWRIINQRSDIVLVEGAGSPAEINLRASDIANMGFATAANVPVTLVGDIDRGGVIASLAGTHRILSDEDRNMICGYLINKFRGDVSLFDDGIKAIEEITSWPCFGIVPWLKSASKLPQEDSRVLDTLAQLERKSCKIAVPRFSRIANFDDLDPLLHEKNVSVEFIQPGTALPKDCDCIILPGSKSTIADLKEMRENGWDLDLYSHVVKGGKILGICGGYQMLGKMINDPHGLEGEAQSVEGIGLLDVETTMEPEKKVRVTVGSSVMFNLPLEGYEIHIGRTSGPDCQRPFSNINGHFDGARCKGGKVMGTYLHGLFAADEFRRAFIHMLGGDANIENYKETVDQSLDDVAWELEQVLDIEQLLANMRPQ